MNNIRQKGEPRKQVKATEKRRTEVSRDRTHATQPDDEELTKPSWQPSGTAWPCPVAWPDRAPWHGRFRLPNLLDVYQYFGMVASCLGARPCHSHSASQLKFVFGVILGHT